MEAAADLSGAERGKDDDAAGRLTYEIFSLLEAKFLFGRDVGLVPAGLPRAAPAAGKVCVLSIDGGARAADGLLAGAALVRLEAALRRRAGSPAARLADFFDVAAGSGAGGVLAAMLFARGPRGRPMYTAEDALAFLLRRVRWGTWYPRAGVAVRLLRRGGGGGPGWSAFGRALGDLTLRDTVRPVLVPCYDLATRAPFLFSRADAAESPAHDFRLRDVCAATCAGGAAAAAVEVLSVDGGTRIRAVGGGAALGNPTAAAITHVLNNRREFPAAATVDDLLVISIGTGEPAGGGSGRRARAPEVARIAAEGVSDMVRWIKLSPWRSDTAGRAITSASRARGAVAAAVVGERRGRAAARRGSRRCGRRRRCCCRGAWSRCCSRAGSWPARPTPRSWSASRGSSPRSTPAGSSSSRPLNRRAPATVRRPSFLQPHPSRRRTRQPRRRRQPAAPPVQRRPRNPNLHPRGGAGARRLRRRRSELRRRRRIAKLLYSDRFCCCVPVQMNSPETIVHAVAVYSSQVVSSTHCVQAAKLGGWIWSARISVRARTYAGTNSRRAYVCPGRNAARGCCELGWCTATCTYDTTVLYEQEFTRRPATVGYASGR